jgi:mRNA-degrading endonuclease RelE of RelBE toxin-antitoxin system
MARAVTYSKDFKKALRKLRYSGLNSRITRQLSEIVERPEIGKPLSHELKGVYSVYLPPFRILYQFDEQTLTFIDFENRDKVYR